MKDKKRFIFPVIIGVLAVCAIIAVFYINNRYKGIDNIEELKIQAEELYKEGNLSDAVLKLKTYCDNKGTDVEAKTMLGDWYMQSGQEDIAYLTYSEAAMRKGNEEETTKALSVRNTEEILTEPFKNIVLEITPDVRYTKDMTLTITGHNLAPKESFLGKIADTQMVLEEDENYHTTDWFTVDPEGKYLTMSGGFNCAIWQFRNVDGEIFAFAESYNNYRDKNSYEANVYQMARAAIPEDAAFCRVTYFDDNLKEQTASFDEKLTIVYGRLPGESVEPNTNYYLIPDLKEGESILFENGEWKMITESGVQVLSDWAIPSIERGSFFSIDGTLPGKVSFEKSEYSTYAKDGIYTIRFDLTNPSAVGERMDDAKNLGFNAVIGNGLLSSGENHFDNIYPWSEMKLCSIQNGEVIYSGDSRFSTDGSSGDVFVEIPKFYSRRYIDEQYETISISGEMHEGFMLDEAFVTKTGEIDKLYVAAYLTGEDEAGFNSVAGENPVLSLTADEILEKTHKKGEGYEEIDYAALSAIQRLFMVETGLRNSQYLFMGICAYTLPSSESTDITVALFDKEKTNCVEVSDKYLFLEGNNIVIFDADAVDESIKEAISAPRKVTTVINNNDGTQSVYFAGEPINVTGGQTAIAHAAAENGATGGIGGHTGALSTARGTIAFKYRNIENLWGNAYIYVDNVRINGPVATITDRKGQKHKVSYSISEADGDVLSTMVNKNGYDEKYPNVMLPALVGEGATVSTHFGDAYINAGEDGKENVLYFGGAWNMRATAGLFSYVASSPDVARNNVSGRMMYIK